MRDAQRLRSSEDSEWATRRYVFDIPLVANAKIAVVRDEGICRERAKAYANHIRSVADETWPDKPVLVVRVGDMYLVDDLRSRDGEDAYWTVLVLDKKWRIRLSYGGGS